MAPKCTEHLVCYVSGHPSKHRCTVNKIQCPAVKYRLIRQTWLVCKLLRNEILEFDIENWIFTNIKICYITLWYRWIQYPKLRIRIFWFLILEPSVNKLVLIIDLLMYTIMLYMIFVYSRSKQQFNWTGDYPKFPRNSNWLGNTFGDGEWLGCSKTAGQNHYGTWNIWAGKS